jgi:ectoine hydroxylase-related dioxygenase (phytanoyl-CoA dioxygenase family)
MTAIAEAPARLDQDHRTRIAALQDLEAAFDVPATAIAQYRRDGYVKLSDVLAPETIAYYGAEISAWVGRLNRQTKALAERDTYAKAFLQITSLWERSALIREFVGAPRIARIAAALMGVRGVRLYHDQALYKEPGGGHTPWHCDQYYWPLSSANSITAWIPLAAVAPDMGPLAFAAGSQHLVIGRELEISDDSERQMARTLRDCPVDESPFALGNVSFHAGWTFHRAGPNHSDRMRQVMTVIYIEDGIRLAEPRNANQRNDADVWAPGIRVGEPIASWRNPVLWRE